MSCQIVWWSAVAANTGVALLASHARLVGTRACCLTPPPRVLCAQRGSIKMQQLLPAARRVLWAITPAAAPRPAAALARLGFTRLPPVRRCARLALHPRQAATQPTAATRYAQQDSARAVPTAALHALWDRRSPLLAPPPPHAMLAPWGRMRPPRVQWCVQTAQQGSTAAALGSQCVPTVPVVQ